MTTAITTEQRAAWFARFARWDASYSAGDCLVCEAADRGYMSLTCGDACEAELIATTPPAVLAAYRRVRP